MAFFNNIVRYLKNLPRRYQIGGVVVIILAIVGIHFALRSSAPADTAANISHVRVASVADISSQGGPLPVSGKISSVSEATILAESSGEIVSLNRALGDQVGAGETIAQFENSSQRAAVLQAQGAYDAAQAALAKVTGSTAANSGITSGQASNAAAAAKVSAQASLQSAYSAMDDAIHVRADTLFNQSRTNLPQLAISVPDGQLATDLQNERVTLEDTLTASQNLATNPPADLDSGIATMTQNAQQTANFLNQLIKALNESVPNSVVTAATIAADQLSLASARSEVVGAISSLSAAKTAYDSAQSGAATAANSAGTGTNSDIAAAQASVKQALGALNAANANLAKTIIRSPISGTIVSLPITQGDYVSNFSQVAVVSNPGALQVLAYVTPDDAKTLAVGGKATINGTTAGTIVSIAPAIDPTTGKIQVKIGISGDQSDLTDGEVVTVTLNRVVGNNTANKSKAITIPITAAKITPTGPVVFSVENGTLVSHPITFGAILGDQVTVASGLTPDMIIVEDARGLSEGQTVVVDTQ